MSQLRNPTGTKDLNSYDLSIREHIINIAKKCFINFGGNQIDTPVMELYDNVKNLYGEEFHKLVYKFRDEHDELILRYDLTVPFARFVGMNGLRLFRRYQIGTVYRCDDPQIAKGRYRAFMQADFDIAGSDQGIGIFDIEILQLTEDLLTKLLGDSFIIRLNHRDIIWQYLKKFNVPIDKLVTVCSSIDKLDKKSVDEICSELSQKGIDESVIISIKDFIGNLLINRSSLETFEYMVQNNLIEGKTYEYFSELLNRLAFMGLSKNIIFDPLLARGLDYYTGIIFEAYYKDNNIMPSSICAGGRYDNLIGKFSNQGEIPAIGLSLGIERIAAIFENTKIVDNSRKVKVYVSSIGKDMLNERIKLCNELRKCDIATMMSHIENPKMAAQFDDVFNNDIKYMIVIGRDEINSGKIKIKKIDSRAESTHDREDGINILKNLLK